MKTIIEKAKEKVTKQDIMQRNKRKFRENFEKINSRINNRKRK